MNETQSLTIYNAAGDQLPLGIVPTDGTTAEIEALTRMEANMLQDYETIIEQGEKTVIEVGQALLAINRARLYRGQYRSFQEYCTERWGFGRRRAYDLMKASEIADELCANGAQHRSNLNERQLRAVAKLSGTDERIKALGRAKEIAGKKKVSSRHIEEAVNEILGIDKPVIIDVTPEPEPAHEANNANAPGSTTVFIPLGEDKETNEQAIERLFGSIREFAESKEWQPAFHDMLNELERRVDAVLKRNELPKAA